MTRRKENTGWKDDTAESYIARCLLFIKTGAALASESISLLDSRDRLLSFEAASVWQTEEKLAKV